MVQRVPRWSTVAEHDPIEIDFPSLDPRSDPEPVVDDVMEIPDDAEDDLSWLALAFADDDADADSDAELEAVVPKADIADDVEVIPSLEDIEAVASALAPEVDEIDPQDPPVDPDEQETPDIPELTDLDDVLGGLDLPALHTDEADVRVPLSDPEDITATPLLTTTLGADPQMVAAPAEAIDEVPPNIDDDAQPNDLIPADPPVLTHDESDQVTPEPTQPEDLETADPESENLESGDTQSMPSARPRRSGLREELMGTFSQLYGK